MTNRRETFQMLAAALLAAAARGEATANSSQVVNLSDVKATPRPFGEQRALLRGPGMSIGCTTLKPGEQPHAPHKHKEPEVLIITEGEGVVMLEDEPHPVRAGAAVWYEPDRLHGIRNTGTTQLTYYVIKWNLA